MPCSCTRRSASRGTESDDEFEKRSFDLLKRAADLGHTPALYALGAGCPSEIALRPDNDDIVGMPTKQ